MENKKYTVKISDNTGHTELEDLSLDQAVDNIVSKVEQNAHWVWIDGALFEFNSGGAATEENRQKLAARLSQAEDPDVVLSGTLVGGAL
jgi:hypothetical protein